MKKRIEKKDTKKRKVPKIFKIIIIILILIFSLLYYMRFIETNRLIVKESKIESVKIPEDLSGIKIVHISDLYYKSTNDKKYLKKVVNKINNIKPDIVIFSGDLLSNEIEYDNTDIKDLVYYLKKIEANNKFYIMGDNDYDNKTTYILESAYFESLNNKEKNIYGSDNNKIVIHGLGSFLKDDFIIQDAFINNDENIFNIAIFHEGDNIMELEDKSIDLALAGHSLNNMINIPIIKELFDKEGAKDYYNNYYLINNTHLYINSGLGTNKNKLRFFNPPTINLYRLVRKD